MTEKPTNDEQKNENHQTQISHEEIDDFLSCGYCHDSEKNFKIRIPDAMIIIIKRYGMKCKILAIGKNTFDRGGINLKSDKWLRLTSMENLAHHADNIFVNEAYFYILSPRDELYFTAGNHNTKSDIKYQGTSQQITVPLDFEFERLSLKKQQMIISNGNYGHTNFIYAVEDGELFQNKCKCDRCCKELKHGDVSKRSLALSPMERFWGKQDILKNICCTKTYSLFLFESGNVFAFGGKYGDEAALISNNIESIAVGGYFHVLLDINKQITVNGLYNQRKVYFVKDEQINDFFGENQIKAKSVACGDHHGVVVTTDGDVYTFGKSDWGQCGYPYDSATDDEIVHKVGIEDDVEMASCGIHHTLLLTENTNNVYSFGSNYWNECSVLCKDREISDPYLMDKEKELGLKRDEYICKVIGVQCETIIIINQTIIR